MKKGNQMSALFHKLRKNNNPLALDTPFDMSRVVLNQRDITNRCSTLGSKPRPFHRKIFDEHNGITAAEQNAVAITVNKRRFRDILRLFQQLWF
jgi:hypothetical protein